MCLLFQTLESEAYLLTKFQVYYSVFERTYNHGTSKAFNVHFAFHVCFAEAHHC